MTLRLDWCSHQAASYAVRAWHYSRSLPCPPMIRIGCWERGAFIGVVLFSRGANRHLSRQFGLPQTAVAELSRIALRQHETPVSRIITIAVRLLRQRCPGLRLVVSFADPEQGHHGGIYQAAGWLYLGQSEPSRVYIDSHERRWHPRMVSRSGRKRVYGELRRVVRIDDCDVQPVAGKHRYVLPLEGETRARLLPLMQPYPRRKADEVLISGTADTIGRGHCDVTRPLHSPGEEGHHHG